MNAKVGDACSRLIDNLCLVPDIEGEDDKLDSISGRPAAIFKPLPVKTTAFLACNIRDAICMISRGTGEC